METRSRQLINWRLVVALILVAGAIALRLIPHTPNFAPIGALALFGGMVLGGRLGILLPLLAVGLSDILIGFYPGIIWTWSAFLVIGLLGQKLREQSLARRIVLGGLGSALIFFIVSNFGVWLSSGMYAHDLSGFFNCYISAIPFFRATLLSDLIYSTVLLGLYQLVIVQPPVAHSVTNPS